jgi:NAD(P)-dependent dehydrogenase (short-subunit alcohol dehydrogenase family)
VPLSLEATVAGLPSSGVSVETALADVSELAEVESVVARAVERFGRLDVLISNAGVLSSNGRIHNLATEEWERAFRVNVLGAVNGIRAAVAVMRPQRSGSIILTASVSGLTAWSHAAPYCATKAAVIQLAKVAAVEYARDGIRVNCVCPGTFRSAIHDDLPPEALDAMAERGIRSGWDRPPTWPGPTPIWPATPPGGRPDRPWWSTAGTRRRERLGTLAAGRMGDPLHEDVGERLGHIARRQTPARLQPQVGVVVHAEPGHGRQSRFQITELARVRRRPGGRLRPAARTAGACVGTGLARSPVRAGNSCRKTQTWSG